MSYPERVIQGGNCWLYAESKFGPEKSGPYFKIGEIMQRANDTTLSSLYKPS